MSGFQLVPVDGGDPVLLPPGETVLGRGPLLGISDKRVSRHHGLLENLNGGLRLKPTHLNPCFVEASPTDGPRPLQRGSWHPLHDGDLFSLLPGLFIYRVVAVGGEAGTPRNSQMFEEEGLPVAPQPDVEVAPPAGRDGALTPPLTPPPAAAQSRRQEAGSPGRHLNESDSAPPVEAEDDRSAVPPPEPRRRVLPAWMMAPVAPRSSSSSSKARSAVRGRKGAARSKISSPEEEEEEEEEDMPKRKRRRQTVDEEDEAPSEMGTVPGFVPADRPASGSSRSRVADESDGFTVAVGGEGGAETSTKRQPGAEDVTSVASDGDPAAPPTPRVRAPCPYGRGCYRKNPVHFLESSHPGDTDYEEEEEQEDRPECPYGTDCYRKNPLHRKEYKHTQEAACRTRTTPRKTPAEEEDSYDSVSDDDSDYAPPHSDDSGEEDIKRLQREAKASRRTRR